MQLTPGYIAEYLGWSLMLVPALIVVGLVALVAHIGNSLERKIKAPRIKPIQLEPQPPLSWRERLWSAAVHGMIIAAVIFLAWPGDRQIPPSEPESTMRFMVMKLHHFVDTLPEVEAENLRTKSIQDFVDLHALDPSDAAYVRAYHIIFHGYDPDHADHETPVLEAVITRRFGKPKRIVCFGDGSCRPVPAVTESSVPRTQ